MYVKTRSDSAANEEHCSVRCDAEVGGESRVVRRWKVYKA